MNMEWENELKQDIPNLEKRMAANTQQVQTAIQGLKNNKRNSRPWLFSGAAVAVAIAFSVFAMQTNPWSSDTPPTTQALYQTPSELNGTIKTSYTDQGEFRRDYGKLINQQFPKLSITLSTPRTPALKESYRESYDIMLKEQNPDLITISSDYEYKRLVSAGKLLNLDKYINRDHLNLGEILPSSIQALKDRGKGSIYGLAPTFNSRSLLYNKTLFDQYHIPYPTDQMSWDEILDLAKQFPTANKEKDRIYGFHEMYMSSNSPVYLINMIANTNGLKFMNAEATQVTMDGKEWNHVFHLALEGYQSGLFHKPATIILKDNQIMPHNLKAMDLFTSGKAAMTLDSTEYYIRKSTQALGFKVGIVTPPTSKEVPNTNTFFSNGQIFAIPAKAANPDAAWEVIKYVNSEAVAKIKTQMNSGLTTHLSVLHSLKYEGIDAFYKMKNVTSSLYDFPVLPKNDFTRYFDAIIEDEIAKVMSGKQTIEEAQANIQKREQSNMNKSNAE
ncbi:extracellular solute-binding protein [Paenibacillus psychroresistens]|uniref:Extracellular solute-binding protein n=1 Tax=Paenibacillus psychroresistens TaxID=1778678 RepID=A0A6B8RNM7_9BACL|nr:extracellular solute-binding protein [Paenibacillus psychroresistens]QGQ97155.1 extracellular solute-binding protein [Paenibacillus psychroresistens]